MLESKGENPLRDAVPANPDFDDLLATGGTAAATAKLIQKLGGRVEGTAFAVELTFLNGRGKLPGLDVFSLIQYDK